MCILHETLNEISIININTFSETRKWLKKHYSMSDPVRSQTIIGYRVERTSVLYNLTVYTIIL